MFSWNLPGKDAALQILTGAVREELVIERRRLKKYLPGNIPLNPWLIITSTLPIAFPFMSQGLIPQFMKILGSCFSVWYFRFWLMDVGRQMTSLWMNSALVNKSMHFSSSSLEHVRLWVGLTGSDFDIWNGAMMEQLLLHMLVKHSLRMQNNLDFRALLREQSFRVKVQV